MIIGITGPIASGKDTIISLFESEKPIIIDADRIGKYIVRSNFEKISNIYKVNDIFDLSRLVFSDYEIFQNYNEFIHPILIKKLKEPMIKNKDSNNESLIVLNCALLFLFKLEFFCDKIIFIDADKQIRKNRLINRNGLSEKEAAIRIEFQNRLENYEKIKINKEKVIYIENNEDLSALTKKIKNILSYIYHKG